MSFVPVRIEVCTPSSRDNLDPVLFCKKIYWIRERKSVILKPSGYGSHLGNVGYNSYNSHKLSIPSLCRRLWLLHAVLEAALWDYSGAKKLVENALFCRIVQLCIKNIPVCAGACTQFYTWGLGFKLLNLNCFDMERVHLPAIAEVSRIAQVKTFL